MEPARFLVLCGTIWSIDNGAGQLSRFRLDDDGSPGELPPGINPPGEEGSPGCCGLPVVIPPPEIPLPICPGGFPPLFGPDGESLQFCLPTTDDCPPNSACWYNGINYYCCPMEGGPGYGPATKAPPSTYGGGRGRPPGGAGRPPGGKGKVKPPGTLPKGVEPPSGDGEVSAPGTLPKGVEAPADSGSSEESSAPGTLPKGVSPPSDESGEKVKPPGKLPHGVNPPSNAGPYPAKRKPGRGRGGPQPPPFGAGTFPNPFTCCKGGGFFPPSHLPRNVNAPSDRAIGFVQFFGGSNTWPPKETGKAKFGGPIKPDYLWFPGQHSHFTNEIVCCGNGQGPSQGQGGVYGQGQSRPQPGPVPPAPLGGGGLRSSQ